MCWSKPAGSSLAPHLFSGSFSFQLLENRSLAKHQHQLLNIGQIYLPSKSSQGFSTTGSVPFWSCSKSWKAPCIIAWFKESERLSDWPPPTLTSVRKFVQTNHVCFKTREGEAVRPCNFHRKHYFPESPLKASNGGRSVWKLHQHNILQKL